MTSDGKWILAAGSNSVAILDFKRREVAHKIKAAQKSIIGKFAY